MIKKYKREIIAAVAILTLIVIFNFIPDTEKQTDITTTEEMSGKQENTSAPTQTGATPTKIAQKIVNVVTQNTSSKPTAPSGDLEFIDKRFGFDLKNYSGVKLTVEKAVLGKGEVATATGCNGVPNADFTAYLYPLGSVCISEAKVDGSPRAILAFHLLVENNGNYNFGGNPNTLRVHYKHTDSDGVPRERFAEPLLGLASYTIPGYSSKNIVLSFLVPSDQKVFDVLIDHKEPAYDSNNKDYFYNSTNAFFVDFLKKSISLIK